MIQILSSRQAEAKADGAISTEKIEMQSKSDLKLKELKEKQKDLEQAERRI